MCCCTTMTTWNELLNTLIRQVDFVSHSISIMYLSLKYINYFNYYYTKVNRNFLLMNRFISSSSQTNLSNLTPKSEFFIQITKNWNKRKQFKIKFYKQLSNSFDIYLNSTFKLNLNVLKIHDLIFCSWT